MKKLNTEELNRINIDEFKETQKTPIIVVLDNIRSLNNVGSVFRTSDAFLIEAIYLCGITAQPPHKDIHKTALGATESVEWKYFEDTKDAIKSLKDNNYLVASVEQTESSVKLQELKIDQQKKYAIVMGHEVKGVDQEVVNQSDFVIEIPQFGTKHSFNISVTTGIVLWEMFRQFKF
jgi:tRNA G18 (ribose-2'-O)-methylase SpoU